MTVLTAGAAGYTIFGANERSPRKISGLRPGNLWITFTSRLRSARWPPFPNQSARLSLATFTQE